VNKKTEIIAKSICKAIKRRYNSRHKPKQHNGDKAMTNSTKDQVIASIMPLELKGAVLDIREGCAYVELPNGATLYYDWSTDELIFEVY